MKRECPICNGTGQQIVYVLYLAPVGPDKEEREIEICAYCEGEGKIENEEKQRRYAWTLGSTDTTK
jgi:DnaJ-class molecular chaperone